jgi:hypothetical protein
MERLIASKARLQVSTVLEPQWEYIQYLTNREDLHLAGRCQPNDVDEDFPPGTSREFYRSDLNPRFAGIYGDERRRPESLTIEVIAVYRRGDIYSR